MVLFVIILCIALIVWCIIKMIEEKSEKRRRASYVLVDAQLKTELKQIIHSEYNQPGSIKGICKQDSTEQLESFLQIVDSTGCSYPFLVDVYDYVIEEDARYLDIVKQHENRYLIHLDIETVKEKSDEEMGYLLDDIQESKNRMKRVLSHRLNFYLYTEYREPMNARQRDYRRAFIEEKNRLQQAYKDWLNEVQKVEAIITLRNETKLGIRPSRLSELSKTFPPLKVDEFFEEYRSIKRDMTGCYILYNAFNGKYYVGQSKGIFGRVNQHFTGGGNGDVYADLKYGATGQGDEFYVQLLPLSDYSIDSNLDATEKYLIEKFDAYNSGYNKTSGNGEL